MANLVNLARMTTSTTGTGSITLGSAVAGFLSFANAGVSNGDVVTYAIKDGSSSEIGRGTYTSSGTTLSRSVLRSTNSDNPISLSGSAEVLITAAAEDFSDKLFAANNLADVASAQSARANIVAASVAASETLGILSNPLMAVSQEHGGTSGNISSAATRYGADEWMSTLNAGTAVIAVQQIADPFSSIAGYRRLRNAVRLTVGTTQASMSAGNFVYHAQNIEGVHWGTLGWGTADARDVDVVAIVHASVGGTYPLSIRNAAGNRSYVRAVTLATGINVVLERIPSDTSGTWGTGSVKAADVGFAPACGTNLHATAADTWESAGSIGLASGINMAATSSATLTIGYMNVFAAGVLPWASAAQITGEALQQLLSMRRPYEDDLHRCQRYYRINVALPLWMHATTTGTAMSDTQGMRTAPSSTILGGGTGKILEVSIAQRDLSSISVPPSAPGGRFDIVSSAWSVGGKMGFIEAGAISWSARM